MAWYIVKQKDNFTFIEYYRKFCVHLSKVTYNMSVICFGSLVKE
jgi:hypothetical protein